MNWGQTLTIITPIIVALLALIGTLYGRRLSKRTDSATARRTEAEATKLDVETARGLVEEVRMLSNQYRDRYNEERERNTEQRVEYEKRLTSATTQITTISDQVRLFEARQATLLALLAAHAPWDFAAWSALKQSYPDYPGPPPLDTELDEFPRVNLVHRHRHMPTEPPTPD